MNTWLLPESGTFYKANLHCHTVLSDGTCTPAEAKDIYKSMGYSILAYTDHNLFIPHDDLADKQFLPLHGFEIDLIAPATVPPGIDFVRTCHICMIALEPDNLTQPCWHRTDYLFANAPKYRHLVKFDESLPDYVRRLDADGVSEIMRIGREKGFFVTYNHPTWSRERYPEYTAYQGMHAFEIFNGGCFLSGHEDENSRVYEDLLNTGHRIYCIGSDDNHNHHPGTRRWDSGVAWTMIKADRLDYRTVTTALENGHFYASMGPEIHALWVEDGQLHIRCSPADRINLLYQYRAGAVVYSENGIPVTEAVFPLWPSQGYFRISVTDAAGRRAYTNAYDIPGDPTAK